jgi:hypothetical protein
MHLPVAGAPGGSSPEGDPLRDAGTAGDPSCPGYLSTVMFDVFDYFCVTLGGGVAIVATAKDYVEPLPLFLGAVLMFAAIARGAVRVARRK